MKALQRLSDEYLRQCLSSTIEQRIDFIENFRNLCLNVADSKSVLISMKIKTPLLEAFRQQCQIENIPYQTKIKQLMEQHLRQQGLSR